MSFKRIDLTVYHPDGRVTPGYVDIDMDVLGDAEKRRLIDATTHSDSGATFLPAVGTHVVTAEELRMLEGLPPLDPPPELPKRRRGIRINRLIPPSGA